MSDWVTIVDDDVSNLKMASHILNGEELRVSCLKSGDELLGFLKANRPDLILLDIHMPGMDGFETIKKINEDEATKDIPVIFLTADEDADTETEGLSLGAMDFIKKPFVPEVLLLRVRHTIDLIRLKSDLSSEVEKKTVQLKKKTEQLIEEHNKTERMTMQIVKALSGAIDAKDTYTNGHSTRVAQYSREIARRAGFDEKRLEEIYMMGLLHDVGKIGVPDAIINKPSKLSNEEYGVIQNHPVMGARILKNITEFPKMATGARWHHERYDGNGYPDGLKGEDIPEEARIIAVADAYDAMTSRRSYRDVLPQEKVRSEVERCRGTQFDPGFADILLSMIDDDKEYKMREE
ncbi:MAG: response regulator [Lachnospiraceae bacterium]|nr:response regulator [Lachnospiraceae bacterium]